MQRLKTLKRIAVIGNAGSGKSTVAQKLQSVLHLPLYHLDQYFWKPGWGQPDRDEYKKIHDELCDRDEWIIEGTNLSLWDHRMERAQALVILKIPRLQCLWRIVKRAIKFHGKETPSSAQGCPERINGAFFKFLKWAWDFELKFEAKVAELMEKYGHSKPIIVLQSQKEIDTFLS